MKTLKVIILISTLLLGQSLYAQDFTKRITTLVEKGYTFYAFKKKTIYYLDGKKKYQQIAFEELYRLKMFSVNPNPLHPPGIARDVVYYHKQGYKIVLRKDKNFFVFKKGKLSKFNPKKYMQELK